MNNVFDAIQVSAKALKIDAYATDVAVFAEEKEFNKEQLEAIAELLGHLKDDDNLIDTEVIRYIEPKQTTLFDF